MTSTQKLQNNILSDLRKESYITGSLTYNEVERIVKTHLKSFVPEITLEAWRGKDELKFQDMGDFYLVTQHQKDKKTHKVKTITNKISWESVNTLWNILKELPEKTNYKEVAKLIIDEYELNCNVDEFNGGKWRTIAYFKYYYWQMRILENKGYLNFGRTIERLI